MPEAAAQRTGVRPRGLEVSRVGGGAGGWKEARARGAARVSEWSSSGDQSRDQAGVSSRGAWHGASAWRISVAHQHGSSRLPPPPARPASKGCRAARSCPCCTPSKSGPPGCAASPPIHGWRCEETPLTPRAAGGCSEAHQPGVRGKAARHQRDLFGRHHEVVGRAYPHGSEKARGAFRERGTVRGRGGLASRQTSRVAARRTGSGGGTSKSRGRRRRLARSSTPPCPRRTWFAPRARATRCGRTRSLERGHAGGGGAAC